MTISERVAYIKGLADGMELAPDTKEGKILLAIIDVLEDMAYEIEDLNDNQLDIGDELDALSDDLADVEEFVFGLDDDCDCGCDCDCDDDDDDCCCCGDDDDTEFFCAMCPSCGEKIYFDETCDPEEVVCPSCHAPLIDDEDLEDEE